MALCVQTIPLVYFHSFHTYDHLHLINSMTCGFSREYQQQVNHWIVLMHV
ncbi:hypothetical protein RchiOBHm_Chr5g0068791 [Rosa chinensis]|uniref:Uncharacterized protein n=1 Tax=Rosa chinensis TaxID=74649 RepID=A0A2P6QJR9_ROSCH|nr:hypothetical protein RchiOBHm_Chr5g0068791 [Rosa chinensis]